MFPLSYSLSQFIDDIIILSSIDAVSDRDFILEFLSANSITAIHLSRLGEEWVLWASEEFGFITPCDSVSTGSSIMPQKKNPDPMELVRGKSARVVGDLVSLLVLCKGLPHAYNRDLQVNYNATAVAQFVVLCIYLDLQFPTLFTSFIITPPPYLFRYSLFAHHYQSLSFAVFRTMQFCLQCSSIYAFSKTEMALTFRPWNRKIKNLYLTVPRQ